MSVTVSDRGQITVPKAVRRSLGLREGIQIEFVEERSEYRVRKHLTENPFAKWVGYLTHLKGRDVDEMIEEMRGR